MDLSQFPEYSNYPNILLNRALKSNSSHITLLGSSNRFRRHTPNPRRQVTGVLALHPAVGPALLLCPCPHPPLTGPLCGVCSQAHLSRPASLLNAGLVCSLLPGHLLRPDVSKGMASHTPGPRCSSGEKFWSMVPATRLGPHPLPHSPVGPGDSIFRLCNESASGSPQPPPAWYHYVSSPGAGALTSPSPSLGTSSHTHRWIC